MYFTSGKNMFMLQTIVKNSYTLHFYIDEKQLKNLEQSTLEKLYQKSLNYLYVKSSLAE